MSGYEQNENRQQLDISITEAERLIMRVEEDIVGLHYDGPASSSQGYNGFAEVSPTEAAEILRSALDYDANQTPTALDGLDDLPSDYLAHQVQGEAGLETPVSLTYEKDGEHVSSYMIEADLDTVLQEDGEPLDAKLALFAGEYFRK